MAKGKRTKNSINNQIDLSNDLGFDDLDFNADPFKDDRKPAIKIKDGLASGVKSTISNEAFIRSTLKELLPKGFGDTLDLSDKIGEKLSSLYKEAADEVRPAIKDFKRVSSKLVPKDNKLVPERVKKLLKKWQDENKAGGASNLDTRNQRDVLITQQLGEIFKEQSIQADRQNTESDVKNRIQQAVELNRHKDIFGLLNQSNISLSRISQYQATINLQYQKKSLELQHRQLFALYDILSTVDKTHVLQADAYSKIVKNTGLPDWQKIELKELASQKLFNKFSDLAGSTLKGMMPGVEDYLQMAATNIRNKALGGLKDNIRSFRSGLSDAESAREQMAGMGGLDPYGTAGSIVGGAATGAFGKWAAGKLKKPLTTAFPKLKETGAYLENFNEGFVGAAEKFRKSSKWEGKTGPSAFLMRGIQSLLPEISIDKTFDRITNKDLNTSRPFTIRTDRSINEVIPGYLSRILQEMQMIRTGSSNVDLIEYDQDKGRFISATRLMKEMSESIFPKSGVRRTNQILDPIIAQIDPDNKLSEAERTKLKEVLYKNKAEYKDLATGLEGTSAELTKGYLGKIGANKSDEMVFNRRMTSLFQGASDPRALVEQYISQGKQKELINLGIIKRTKDGYELNSDMLFKASVGTDPYSKMMGSRRSKGKGLMGGFKSVPSSFSGFEKESQGGYEQHLLEIISRLDTSIDHYKTIEDLLKTGMAFDVKRDSDNPSFDNEFDKALNKGTFSYDRFKMYLKRRKKKLKQQYEDSSNSGIVRAIREAGGASGEALGSMASTGRRNIKDFDIVGKINKLKQDIKDAWSEAYVSGEMEPRLQQAKMRAGHYIDLVSGKVIESLKDIQNGVKDITVDKVVLKADEINDLYIKDAKGKLFSFFEFTRSKINPFIDKLKNSSTVSKIMKDASDLFSGMKDTYSMVKSTVFGSAKDVWVKGEKTPRLTAVKMQQGKYFDAITGKTIYTPDDIAGEVRDDKGQTKITTDDLPNLVVWDIEQRRFGPIRKLLRGIGKVYGAIEWYYRKIGIPWTKFNIKMIAKAARLGVNLAKLAVGTGPLSVKDVYVGKEPMPRLYAVKIRNGEYFNKVDDKPIYHHTQIKGEIVDKDGNTVIFDEDIPNLKIYDSVLKLFNPLKLVGLVVKGTAKAAGWMIKKGAAASKSAFKIIGKLTAATIGKTIRYLSKPEDVYVKGETTPRLKAVLMKAGRYISEKTGKVIELVTDIDGPVWDQELQTKVIDNDDLSQGLVRANGQPIKTSLLRGAANVIKKINKLFSRRVSLGVKTSMGGKQRSLNKEEQTANTGLKTVALLQDIKDIFNNQFNKKPVFGDKDGDGTREGSWQDILAKRAQQKKGGKQATGATGKDKGKDKKDGILGILGNALEAITGFLGGFKNLLKGGKVLGGLSKLLGIGGAASGLMAGAGAALGAIGTGIAAVVSSPVTLGIVGAAVVGYGAYRGYKALRKWMSKPTALEAVRYVQYGFKKDDTSNFSKIIELEEYLKTFVKVGSDKAEIDDKKLDIKEMMSMFGFSSEAGDHKVQFGTWYMKRFKPVYLTHVSALNIVNGSIDLTKVNDLKKEDKLKYLEAVKFPSGPYTVATLPILGKKFTASTSTDVVAAIEIAMKEISTKPGGGKESTAISKDGKQAEAAPVTPGKVDYGKAAGASKIPGSNVAGASGISGAPGDRKLSAFDIVRFKTYGLKELDSSKVVALTMLESHISKKITYQDTKATFDGNPNALLEKLTTYFGIPDIFGAQAVKWVKWFRDRFLPVYLNYATMHMQAVNKPPKADGVSVLTANQEYDIALGVSATSNSWRVSDSPWPDYELNTNPDTIKQNLLYLKDAVKNKTMADKESKGPATPANKEKASAYATKSSEQGYGSNSVGPSITDKNKSFSDELTKRTTYVMPPSAQNSMGSTMGSSPVAGGDGTTKSLLQYIGNKESRGNYNILVGGKTEPNLTNMTISEVLEYQKGMISRGHESTAVGKYQIIRGTLLELIKQGYATTSDRFSPEVQDKLAIGLLKRRGLDKYLRGDMSKDQFADNLSKEWASLPFNTGRSFYAGVGSNKSSGSRDDFVSVVGGIGGSPGGVVSPGGDRTMTAMADNKGPVAKSIYNPVARPAMMQGQAVAASREASAPLNDAYGFKPVSLNTSESNINASRNTLTGGSMANTENILNQSLDVQKQTLGVMKMIYDKINENADKGSNTAPLVGNEAGMANGYSYEYPKVPVPMRKSMQA